MSTNILGSKEGNKLHKKEIRKRLKEGRNFDSETIHLFRLIKFYIWKFNKICTFIKQDNQIIYF